jgi:hypothetical protein
MKHGGLSMLWARRKILSFQRLLILLLAAAVFCLAACKTEPDLPDDPHVPLPNSFIGVWKEGAQYWQFRTDGTGGKANTQSGPFPDTFSFFVYAGQDVQTAPLEGSLLILEDNGAGGVTVTRYAFEIAGNQAVLEDITLERVSGSPQVLNVTNPLIGEWSADWSWPGSDHSGGTWSLKYRADGTLKLYHHQVQHQFENGYALRGNTLVIFGDMRFGSFTGMPIIAEISQQANGKWQVQEIQEYPGPATWIYTKVAAAKWM